MFRRYVESRIASAERATGVGMDWVRDFYRVSPSGFWKFTRFLPLARHRQAASKEAFAIAHLIGARSEDCGGCVQIVVNRALGDGVDPAVLRAVLDDRPQELAPDLAAVMAYAKAVADRGDDVVDRSAALCRSIGETAVCELAVAVATARLFPVIRRGLGHAESCAMTTLELPGGRKSAPGDPALAHG
jgi:alkylhydroperoxidase family enzyme